MSSWAPWNSLGPDRLISQVGPAGSWSEDRAKDFLTSFGVPMAGQSRGALVVRGGAN